MRCLLAPHSTTSRVLRRTIPLNGMFGGNTGFRFCVHHQVWNLKSTRRKLSTRERSNRRDSCFCMALSEVILIVKLSVDVSCNPRGHGSPYDVALPTHQDDQDYLWIHLVRERYKPSNARALIRTRAGLPRCLFVIRYVTASSRSMEHGCQHAFTNVIEFGFDFKGALDAWLKILL